MHGMSAEKIPNQQSIRKKEKHSGNSISRAPLRSERMPAKTLERLRGDVQTRHELQARGHNEERWYLMQEVISNNNHSVEPSINGAGSHHSPTEDRSRSRGRDADLATAIERLIQFLENAERANHPEQRVQHRTTVDLVALKEWLGRETPGNAVENPGGKPIANRPATPTRASQPEVVNRSQAQQPTEPVVTFRFGDVRTKVWVRHRMHGYVSWGVQQVRIYDGPKGTFEGRTLRQEDLANAARGAATAERWIKKHERRYRLVGWFLGL